MTVKLQTDIPGAINYVSKVPAFKKAVQRERKKTLGHPDRPKDWASFKVPDDLTRTSDNKPFLIVEKEINEASLMKVVGFASPTGIEVSIIIFL